MKSKLSFLVHGGRGALRLPVYERITSVFDGLREYEFHFCTFYNYFQQLHQEREFIWLIKLFCFENAQLLTKMARVERSHGATSA
jgi:hypothetical protein